MGSQLSSNLVVSEQRNAHLTGCKGDAADAGRPISLSSSPAQGTWLSLISGLLPWASVHEQMRPGSG